MSRRPRAALLQALLSALLWCFVQGLYQECVGEGGQGQVTACQPDIEQLVPAGNFNLILDPIDVTCGSPSSKYRRLGDRTSFLEKICDASSSDPALNHALLYMTDKAGQVTWWQSVTMATSGITKPLHVNITLSFKKRYTLMGDVTVAFNSGRPEVMVLEKSADYGVTWSPLQYYARNCSEFYQQGADYRVTAETLTAAICDNTTAEITSLPRPGGKVVFPVFDQRLRLLLGPTEMDFSRYYTSLDTSDITEFLTFTDLRLRLLEPATDGGTNFNMYYYAISDIEVLARCECNLHAARCIADVTGQTVCECSHNTAGRDCEMCLPLYNDRPWQKGKYSPFNLGTANQCQRCECNDHAVACVYDPQYARGVCQDCQHNTTGRHCERCMPGFFPNDTLPVNDSSRCADCDCEPLGTVQGSTACSQVAGLVMSVGQCDCRPLVTGRRCDRCDPGYYGLLMADTPGVCKACDCHPDGTVAGSVCAESDGQCTCKVTTSGRRCDVCADGYYDFPTGQPSRGCLPCACDTGGAVSTLCDVMAGVCSCRQHMEGLKCDQVEAGYYVPALDVTYQPETSTGCNVTKDLWRSDRPFDGRVFASCDVTTDVMVQFQPVVGGMKQVELAWSYHPALRYTLFANGSDVTLNGTLTLIVNGSSGANVTCPHPLMESQTFEVTFTAGPSVAWMADVTLSIDIGCRYDVTLSISRKTSVTAPVQVDSFVLLPSLTSSSANKTLGMHDSASQEVYRKCLTQLAALTLRHSGLTSVTCRGIFRSVAAQLFNGAQACGCDPVGTEAGTLCDGVGGQCHCKPGVAGRACDECLPGFFNFSSTGCTACDCDPDGSSHGACDVSSGQCACLQNVARAEDVGTSGVTGDRKCSQCRQNFYGQVTSIGCLPCNCHVTGSNGSQCDFTGQCPCVSSVQGLLCDKCRPGYFAFGASGCRLCGCDVRGSLNVSCDQGLGTCFCKDHVAGTQCDKCKDGYFNMAAVNPRGCQPCFCFQHGTTCISATGFVEGSVASDSTVTWNTTNDHYVAPPHFQGDHHVSYGQLLSVHLTTSLPLPDLHNMTWVVLQGDGEQGPMRLSHVVTTNMTSSTPTSSMLEVRLHAVNWRRDDGSTPTETEMLRVLADLKSLFLPRQLAGATLTYSDIVMETAVAGSGGNVSTYVENCTCSSVSGVSGLSCENCDPGTRRVNTNLTSPYQVCTDCNCSRRALTTPPLCDQWTGVCLNCRNSTEGEHCQLCAQHVQGVECNMCEDGYWGLGRYGCQACNCSQPGLTSSVCDKGTGQCACAPFVSGRRCESCQENYHSLTATGCQECDACYKLVLSEVTSLRVLMQNLTSSVSLLETNDRTRDLGDFWPRLNSVISTSQHLLAFLTDTTQTEDSVKSQLASLTSLTLQLGDTVRRLADNTTSEIEAVLSQTSRQFQSATLTSQATRVHVDSAYSQLAPLFTTVPSIQSLATSLHTVESDLQVRADNANTARLAALSELQELEQVINEANSRAQSTLQTVQSALVAHQNNSRGLTDLEGVDVTLNVLTADTLTEARRVRIKSQDVIQSAGGLQSTIASSGQTAIDTAGMKQYLADVTSRADTMQTQAAQASFNFTSTETQVATVTVATETLRARVQTLVNDVNGMTSRVTTANQRARAAQQETGAVFQAADTMLQTMQNFDARARDVELKTNTSLAAMEAMRQNSADVRVEADAVTLSLAVSQQAASQAIDISRQAKTIADVQFNRLSPVAVSAQTLQNTTTDLDDVTVSAQRTQAILTSSVRPANLTCSKHQQLMAVVKTQVEVTASLIMNVTNRVDIATNRANTLLSNLRNLPSVDLNRIMTLLADVNSVRSQFNTTELTSAITGVQTGSAAHTARIAQLTARKAELQAKVKQLQAIRQQLIP